VREMEAVRRSFDLWSDAELERALQLVQKSLGGALPAAELGGLHGIRLPVPLEIFDLSPEELEQRIRHLESLTASNTNRP